MPPIYIRPIQSAHYADYVTLIGKQLGEGYLTEADFIEIAEDNQAICFEAINEQNEVVGILTAVIRSRQDALNLLKISSENLPSYATQSEYIGIFKTIAISEKNRGVGIGSALTEALMNAFYQNGVSTVACIAWQYGKTENIRGVMQRFGFQCVKSIPDYWKDDPHPFICPACGSPPCRCQANIYFKSLC